MKKIFFVLSLVFCHASLGWAQTLYLKDGTVVKGRILEKGSYFVTIDSGGHPRKYYSDQIARIAEEPSSTDLTGTVNQPSPVSPAKLNLINQLIDLNGTRRNIQKNFDQILARAAPQKKEELTRLFQTGEIIERLIPVYDKNFSEQELGELIKFYQSPVGQKTLEATPKIMSEALDITVKYFEEKLNVRKQ